jgi:hypothetical protein
MTEEVTLLCSEMMVARPMEPKKSNPDGDTKVAAKPVTEIVQAATTVPHKVSVRTALKELQVQRADLSLVTNEGGKLLGSVSKDQMNRKVGGLGHDPKTFPVEPQVEKPAACRFEPPNNR